MEAASVKTRRRPSQSRSRATAEAIQQAFVQLLTKNSYANISIRQVIALAGVGAGSFYEYFSSKDSLAAVCIHLRIKEIAAVMRQSIETTSDQPLPARVDALLAAQSEAALTEPEQWAALFQVERQVSGIEAFRRLYAEYVQLWVKMLRTSPDWPAEAPNEEAAFAAHSMAYSLVSQALMTRAFHSDADTLRRLLRNTVHGYLSVLAPHAYRLHRFDV